MAEDNKKHEDTHGTEKTTKWVHKHRTAAKWLSKAAVLSVATLLYYLKKQSKKIVEEEKNK